MSVTADFEHLVPETMLDAVEKATGRRMTGLATALPSYINRVYEVQGMAGDRLIAKFYRPGRWSDEQIREEHSFSLELEQAEIPLVAPTVIEGETLFHHDGFRFTVFRRQGGHAGTAVATMLREHFRYARHICHRYPPNPPRNGRHPIRSSLTDGRERPCCKALTGSFFCVVPIALAGGVCRCHGSGLPLIRVG